MCFVGSGTGGMSWEAGNLVSTRTSCNRDNKPHYTSQCRDRYRTVPMMSQPDRATPKKPRRPNIETVLDHVAWSYANLARADAAVREGCEEYKRQHHIIRSRLFKGLRTGSMSMRSMYDDERLKMTLPQACCYCGSTANLSLDHLIPRLKGGADEADNLVWACRSCNSSKGASSLLAWMESRNNFPSLFVLRRYLKLVARYCEKNGLMQLALDDAREHHLPFELELLPYAFPPLNQLKHWVEPETL